MSAPPSSTVRKLEKLTATAVASCTRPRDQKCGFFLAAVDDSVARLAKASNVPPNPRTPASTRTQAWLTPGTGSSSRNVLFGGSATRTRNLNLNDSPISHRYRGGGGEQFFPSPISSIAVSWPKKPPAYLDLFSNPFAFTVRIVWTTCYNIII